jgi:hypothetical protein
MSPGLPSARPCLPTGRHSEPACQGHNFVESLGGERADNAESPDFFEKIKQF